MASKMAANGHMTIIVIIIIIIIIDSNESFIHTVKVICKRFIYMQLSVKPSQQYVEWLLR